MPKISPVPILHLHCKAANLYTSKSSYNSAAILPASTNTGMFFPYYIYNYLLSLTKEVSAWIINISGIS